MGAQSKRGRPRQEIRDGRKWCAHHKAWELLDEFRSISGHGSASTYKPICKVAEIAVRDGLNAEDPARRFVERRASDLVATLRKAGAPGVSRQFVMDELNYEALVPIVDTLISPAGMCIACGHPFDIKHLHFDHIEPPRWELGVIDWERLHAQNIQILHPGENTSKGPKTYPVWLADNQRKWMAERRWARHAGEKGWPTLEAMRLPPPEPEPELEPEPEDLRMTIFDVLDPPGEEVAA